jgi:hypothetical protein
MSALAQHCARMNANGEPKIRLARPITKKDVTSAQVGTVWDKGNRALYCLCQTYPKHTEIDEIIAKVWLIGRAYAASIERRTANTEQNDTFYVDNVAVKMQAADIDAWLQGLSNAEADQGFTAVAVHKKLMDLFKKISGLDKRSLASKYLHFHRPDTFFIYDSRAEGASRKVTPRLKPIRGADNCDVEYRNFMRRCLWLHEHIKKEHGVTLTPREIDNVLLAVSLEK